MSEKNIDTRQKKETPFWLLLTVPVCIVLALFFISTGLSKLDATPSVASLDPAWYTPETARGEYRKSAVMVGNCFICHALWVKVPPDPTVRTPMFAHAAIKLNHGANDRCYNCHLIYDRNMFTDADGRAIMVQTPEKACVMCHGLIYKDWQNGTHGLRRGKWQVEKTFDRETFTCTECHDPHSPKFKFTDFAPAPTWPDKFVRKGKIEVGGAESEYIVGPEPKEMF